MYYDVSYPAESSASLSSFFCSSLKFQGKNRSMPAGILHPATAWFSKYRNFSIIPGKMDGQLVESGHDMDVARDL